MGDQSKNDDGGAAQSVVNDGGPAFPMTMVVLQKELDDGSVQPVVRIVGGMSLRDWFAGQAMGLLSQPLLNAMHNTGVLPDRDQISDLCYQVADAMIVARGPVPPLPEQSDLQGLRRKVKSLSKALEAIAYAPVGAATASDREVLAGVVKLARTALEGGGA